MKLIIAFLLFFFTLSLYSQTDFDGLMMNKNYFCSGVVFNNSSFDHYWEGSMRRDNLNMGSVSNSSLSIMGNYGITDKLNFIFTLPYISTFASTGNLKGQNGIQDLSLMLKYVMMNRRYFKGDFQAIALGGYSLPMTTYLTDLLPLSIGLGSKQGIAKLILDYEKNNFYTTISGSYLYPSNIHLDRNTYYTTTIHYSDEVQMPDATQLNFRTGYRNEKLICDVFYDYFNTLCGFDIPRNGMPFPSNNMEIHQLGVYLKFETPVNGLSVLGNCYTTFAGRNMGQSTGYGFGAFYILDFSKKKTA